MPQFVLRKLSTLLKDFTETKVEELFRTYKCDRNSDVQDFARQNAIMFQKTKIANTYVFIDSRFQQIYAYFTLTHKEINLDKFKLSEKQMKKYTGFENKDTVSAVLIAQLGKNDNANATIPGNVLWQGVYNILERWEAPFRAIVVDCKDDLIKYYEEKGFTFLEYQSLIKQNTLIKKNDVEKTIKALES